MPADLLQIVPMLPPAVSGVADYALLLARELAAGQDVQTHFLTGTPEWRGDGQSVAPFPAHAVAERSAAALLRSLTNQGSAKAILLHYVGYGYARRGCPFWLVRALERWKRQAGGHLIVLFHEVSGTGPVWTSGFWTSGIQDHLAKRLAQAADERRVTTDYGANRLRAMLPPAKRTIRTQAVFSTLGEPAALVPYPQRRRQMIVFGSPGFRRDAYTLHRADFLAACRRLEIERVIDIGTPLGSAPDLPVPFVAAGVLPAREASDLMNQSTAGFFTYPVTHMGKSTIFAAYCAHSVTPVTFAANTAHGDENRRAGVHFLPLADGVSAARENIPGEAVAAAAHAWYQPHRLAIHAREIAQAVRGQSAH